MGRGEAHQDPRFVPALPAYAIIPSMSGDAKVLTGLLERRALEQAYAELGCTTDPGAQSLRAQEIAAHGLAALPQLLSLLDTPDPQLRGGLGQVARLLPREQVVAALRGAAISPERSDQARIAAATLLERYLGEPVDDILATGLRNPQAAAEQSVAELSAAMDGEPLAIVEYLDQLAQQPADVMDMILDAAGSAPPGPHPATLLRMLAQLPDQRVARRAIDALSRMRTPAACRALASLAPNLPPALSSLAERGMRKLRFSGVSDTADHDPKREPWVAPGLTWRLLLSPVDASGTQFLWFIGQQEAQQRGIVFTVLVLDPYGVVDASGALDAAGLRGREKKHADMVHEFLGDGKAARLNLVEAPLSTGYRALREALQLNWASGTAVPVSYRLFSPLIWLGADRAAMEATEPVEPAAGEFTQSDLNGLLADPRFFGWFALNPANVPVLPPMASFARRYRAMGRWLALAGEDRTARLASTLAFYFETNAPQAISFLAAAGYGGAESKSGQGETQ